MKRFLIGTLWFSWFSSLLLQPIQATAETVLDVHRVLQVKEPAVDLQSAGNYVIVAKSGISTVPQSDITGNIAVSPIAVTGMTGFSFTVDPSLEFSTSTQVTGKAYGANHFGSTPAVLTVAVLDMEAAYTNAAGRTNADASRKELGGGLLGGDFGGISTPLTPGVYTFTTVVSNPYGDIYFEGTGIDAGHSDTDVFIIQTTGDLVLYAYSKVILTKGALRRNIFWQVAGYVNILAGAHMEGILLVKTYAAFVTGSSLYGRVLAQTAVTLQMTTIMEPGAVNPQPELPRPPGCILTPPARIRLLSSTLQERWSISNPAFDYDNPSITLGFEINEYISLVEQVQFTLFDETCENAYTGTGLSGSRGSSFDTGVDGDEKHSIDILVSIDSEKISGDTQVYSEGMVDDQMMATVDFCLRFALHITDSAGGLEVSFLESIVTLNVDLTDGFQTGAVSVEPYARCKFEGEKEFLVEGYLCVEGSEKDSTVIVPVHNQGDLVKICVRPVQDARENSFIRMRQITSFAFERGSTISQQAIVEEGPAANGLTDLWCEPGYAICHFETILLAAFYDSSGSVSGSGFADMQIGGEISPDSVTPKSNRLLRENRELQQNNEDAAGSLAGFDLEILIVPAELVLFSAASSSGGLFAIAVAAGAMVLL
jgi:hypothetical protein